MTAPVASGAWPTVANECARAVLQLGISGLGLGFELAWRWRLADFARAQDALRRRYRIAPDTPIVTYDRGAGEAVERWAAGRAGVQFAATSGSTSRPKRIAFSKQRLLSIKLGSLSIASRLVARHPDWRTGLFILAGLKQDDSLTSLLLHDQRTLPAWLTGLLMPARYASAPGVAPLVERFGATAVRFWLLTLADPALVYSTNPSTLAVFLTEVHDAWPAATALVRAQVREPGSLPPVAQAVVRRLASRELGPRLLRIAAADAPLPASAWLPGLRAWSSWDGGYVRPFLAQIEAHLPADRYTFIPMYSMSTETVETLTHFDGDELRFLPMAPRVLYEFLPEGAEDRPGLLVPATALCPGQSYTMVVSDAFGLLRYQTEDVFACVGKVGDAPDLRFLRRRGLAYSFTGEKLTGLQVEEAFAELRRAFPSLAAAGVQLSMIPSRPPGELLPCYRLLIAPPGEHLASDVDPAALAARLDALLAAANSELAAKLASGRLGATRPMVMRYDRLAARLDAKTRDAGEVQSRTWDTQFKLLPLYQRLWDEHAA